ncbi:MAG: hypothetical protein LBC89_02950 [Bacteroidales bacterium]|jgi:hypothetical protein|nr:hypothetical protein [Bacteroidales bacterium]
MNYDATRIIYMPNSKIIILYGIVKLVWDFCFARNDGSLASNGIRHCEAIAEAIQRTKSIIPYQINNAFSAYQHYK